MSLININKIKKITKRSSQRSIPEFNTNENLKINEGITYYEHHKMRMQKINEKNNKTKNINLLFFSRI